jgi:predicted ATP-dependent endonuclease of OLD family
VVLSLPIKRNSWVENTALEFIILVKNVNVGRKIMVKAKKEPVSVEYRLIELQTENFKKLKAISIKPRNGVFEVAGKNESGKSSTLDSFMAAIGGPDYFGAAPIRDGEKEALIQINLGAVVVVRRIFRKPEGKFGHEVIVQYADGKKPAKPQTVLDELRGSPIADDPLEFTRLKPKERLDLLKKLLPDANEVEVRGEMLTLSFDEIEAERKSMTEDRTQVGRDFDRAKGAAESIVLPANAPTNMVDVTELAAQLRAAGDTNASIDSRTATRMLASDRIDAIDDEIDRLQAEQKALRDKLTGAEPLPEKIDTMAIEQQIMDADAINAVARKVGEKATKMRERDELGEQYDALTKAIAILDKFKTDAITSAKLPIDGLGFGDNDITLDGLPFENASSARKIKTATALLMAMKPDIKVLLVREGSLLDEDMRAALDEDAKKHGFVVLLETVGGGDGTGVVISDGEVV